MTITLNQELQAFLSEQVRLGKYPSLDEAVADAIRQLKNREEKIGQLRREIQIGIDQLERGEGGEWNVEDVKAKLRAKYPGNF
jgi:antitoxin ParD1/3/4